MDGEEGERDPLEDELLAGLEELAQKTDVLTHWADEMYEYVKAVPQSELLRGRRTLFFCFGI
jgi:serine/threonine-protein kinase ULK/ATG1